MRKCIFLLVNNCTVQMGASRSVGRTLTLGLCPSLTQFLCNLRHVAVSYIKMEIKLHGSALCLVNICG